MRGLVLCALVVVLVTCGGCGGGGPTPRHGILFSHDGDLYLLWPGRAHPQRLTSSPDRDDEPAWSPNGKQIAFTRTTCGTDPRCGYGVFVANSDGSGGRALTSSDDADIGSKDPSWSPDGRRIAFLREMNLGGKLGIRSVAGGDVETPSVSGTDFAWGRLGIAYLVPRVSRVRNLGKPRNSIRIFDPRMRRRREFGSPPVGYTIKAIAWSARDELAAFETHQGYSFPAQATIYSAAGRRISQFDLPKRLQACGLTWSPDGRRLLFAVRNVRPGKGGPQLYTVDPYGRHWHHLRSGLALSSCDVSWR